MSAEVSVFANATVGSLVNTGWIGAWGLTTALSVVYGVVLVGSG